jgi:hypothetical protein
MNFKEKIELLNQVKKEFQRGVDLNFQNITSTISVDDVISADFEELYLPLFERYKEDGESFKKLFNTKLESNRYSDSVGRELSYIFRARQDRNKIIDKYFRYAEEIGSFNLANFAFLSEDGDENYINSKILTNEKLSAIMISTNSRDVISKLWDKVLMTADEETINGLFKFLEENESEYTNLPLVILNKNISDENKISIIVKTYKQKDLNKYTTFMRENIVDLKDLDSFIEATVLQNNRVKEKERAVQDVIKRIFVGIRGNSSSINFNKFTHTAAFFAKYRKYMTPNFCNTIVNENNYYTRRNANELVTQFYMDAEFEDKMYISSKIKGLGQRLFDNISNTLELHKDDPVKEKLILNYMLTEFSMNELWKKFSMEGLAKVVNKHPEIFGPKMGKLIDLTEKSSSWRRGINMDEVIQFLKLIDTSVLERKDFQFVGSGENQNYELERTRNFGFSSDNDNNKRSSYYSNNAPLFFDFLGNFLKNATMILSHLKSDVIKKKFYDTFFYTYADEEYVQSELLSILTNSLDKNTMDGLISAANTSGSGVSRSFNEQNIFGDLIFKSVIRVIEEFYPEHYDDVKTNLETLETSLRIIINI